jgi:hypothetical protein
VAVIAAPAPARTHATRWWTLAVLCLSLFMVVVDNTIVNVAPPSAAAATAAGAILALLWLPARASR